MVVLGLLDHVSPDDVLVAVVAVLLVGDEVGLAEELLLVILEFADHGCVFLQSTVQTAVQLW